MRKHQWAIVFLALAPLFVTSAYAGGLGVSNKNIVETVDLGETKIFELGRVYNERNVSLLITVEWHNQGDSANVVLKMGDTKITATVGNKILEAGKATFVYAEVTGLKLGECSGTVEVSTEAVNPLGGNPTLPRGQLTAKFVVLDVPASNPPTPTLLFVTTSIIASIVVVITVVWKKRGKVKSG